VANQVTYLIHMHLSEHLLAMISENWCCARAVEVALLKKLVQNGSFAWCVGDLGLSFVSK